MYMYSKVKLIKGFQMEGLVKLCYMMDQIIYGLEDMIVVIIISLISLMRIKS